MALLCLLTTLAGTSGAGKETMGSYAHHHFDGRSIVFSTSSGQRLRVTPYGDQIVRIQAVRPKEEFFPDDHYEMVESHQWDGSFRPSDRGTFFLLETRADNGLVLHVNKNPMRILYVHRGEKAPTLQESDGIWWEGSTVHTSFMYHPQEHFTGLGHGYFGRSDRLDLKGEVVQRNYGTAHGQQAPLIVPFYLSSNGYGIFLNSMFPNSFSFGKGGVYEFSIDGDSRMDYFFIRGPDLVQVIDRYTQLTGRPRFPPMAMFGLALSDKGHDHTSATPSDEMWWKQKISEHRSAGFPMDHVVNDNRWRAGGGKRCESYLAWDSTRYPDPAEYEQWVQANGLVVTLDFNRCIASRSDGWKPSFNIPDADSIEFGHSAPDFTRKEVREWFWNLFWCKSLNPELRYPGDALWIDEFDEMGKAPPSMVLGNGRRWLEMRNYWFFLMAKALVQEGWDVSIGPTKRPFVWVRGMTAGAQRYATLWSGDIKPSYDDMKTQIRGMQLAGLSGFPFWGHDAGGFHGWESGKGPDDTMYRQWSMAFGCFTPFWKPHGMGQSRWPLDRSIKAQQDAKKYSELRYTLMPYIYTYVHRAFEAGIPIARAMIIEHQGDSLAWEHDLQYMWGREMLVAPNCSDSGNVTAWLPDGVWYDFWDDTKWQGNQVINYDAPVGVLPLFVKAGSIIPMAPPALSTAFMSRDSLVIHIYTGADASFTLYEDDGITERYRTNGEKRTTDVIFTQSSMSLRIAAGVGSYEGAPARRTYRVDFHGLSRPLCMEINGKPLTFVKSVGGTTAAQEGIVWDEGKKCLSALIKSLPIAHDVVLKAIPDCPKGGKQ